MLTPYQGMPPNQGGLPPCAPPQGADGSLEKAGSALGVVHCWNGASCFFPQEALLESVLTGDREAWPRDPAAWLSECSLFRKLVDLNTQSPVVFWEVVEPLGRGALLEEVGCCGWALRFYTSGPFPFHSLCFLTSGQI